MSQTGHLTLPADPKLAFIAYTKASERTGNADAQYKLGFLYGSNLENVLGGEEGVGNQASVSKVVSVGADCHANDPSCLCLVPAALYLLSAFV